MSMMPSITTGVVVAHAPASHSVMAILRSSGNEQPIPVRVPFFHAADSLRVSQKAMPGLARIHDFPLEFLRKIPPKITHYLL